MWKGFGIRVGEMPHSIDDQHIRVRGTYINFICIILKKYIPFYKIFRNCSSTLAICGSSKYYFLLNYKFLTLVV